MICGSQAVVAQGRSNVVWINPDLPVRGARHHGLWSRAAVPCQTKPVTDFFLGKRNKRIGH
jgi:hypothetical protein